MPDWTWQGVITSIVATVLWFGGASVLTWIRKKWPNAGNLALFWVASAACLAVLWYTATGIRPFTDRPERVTADNIETNLKTWCTNLGLAFVNQSQAVPDSYFAYTVTTRDGNQIVVSRRTKEKPAYLQFETDLVLPPLNRRP